MHHKKTFYRNFPHALFERNYVIFLSHRNQFDVGDSHKTNEHYIKLRS